MLQNAPIGALYKRVRAHPEHHIHLLFPDLDPAMVIRVLGRVRYTTAQEREAEMTASLIRGRSAGPDRTTLGRVAHAFGFTE